jgi:hypothetical protein
MLNFYSQLATKYGCGLMQQSISIEKDDRSSVIGLSRNNAFWAAIIRATTFP